MGWMQFTQHKILQMMKLSAVGASSSAMHYSIHYLGSQTIRPEKQTAFKQLVLNNKLFTVLVLNPLGRLASAGPGLASGGVTVFGSHLGATGAAACTARREHVLRSQAKFFYQRTNLAQRTGQLGAAGFADLFFKVFTLLEQFFVAGHVKHIQWVERCQL